MCTKKIKNFFKKHKKLIYSFAGFTIAFQILFLAIWFFAIIDTILYGNSDYAREKLKSDKDLIVTNSRSSALEIQAFLARNGLRAERFQDGTKTRLILPRYRCRANRKHCTEEDYDLAIILLVKSGLYNKNIGLELFDKSNIFSTKEEVRLKFINSMNYNLANLIKRLEGIEDANVIVSIPEQAMYKKDQFPIKAAIQITPVGENILDTKTITAIKNIMLGAVSGLTEENITLTDTKNNIYF